MPHDEQISWQRWSGVRQKYKIEKPPEASSHSRDTCSNSGHHSDTPRASTLPIESRLHPCWPSAGMTTTTAPVVTSPRTGVRLRSVPTNRNTEWLNQKAAWCFYVILIVLCWLVTASWTDPGMAWTYVHLGHGVLSYFLLHWNKGSPIQDDQGIYDK